MPITNASAGMPNRARHAARSTAGTGTKPSAARLLGMQTTFPGGIPSRRVSSAATLGLFARTRWAARHAHRFAIAWPGPVLGFGFHQRRLATTRGTPARRAHGTPKMLL